MSTKFVTSLMLTLLFAVGAAAEGKRLLVVMKSQDSYQSAKVLMGSQGGKEQILDISLPKSVRELATVGGKVEKNLDRIQSIVLKNASEADLANLRSNPNVAFVEEEVFHALPPKPFGMGALTIASTEETPISTRRLPLENFRPSTSTPWGIGSVRAVESWTVSHGGQGARVLVLDTGIDKDHGSLADNFEAGRDFVGDNQPNYPFNDTHGHGTHTAGTIAGLAAENGFTGVAPEARILAGRVCGDRGCSNIAIAQGVDWGVEQKVDVISMSLGGMWSTPAERMAISRAIQAGVTVVAASGNSGTSRVSYPAALPDVIAVGAVDDKLQRAPFSQYGPELAVVAPGVAVTSAVPRGSGRETDFQITIDGGTAIKIESSTFQGAADLPTAVENTLVAAGLGKPEDFANIDVKGKFVFMFRGEIAFGDKVKNAIAAGATGAVIANNVPGLLHGTLAQDGSKVDVPVFGLDQDAGNQILAALNEGKTVQSRMFINRTDFSAMDGTSMATPHVSGVVALMKAANKYLTPAQVKQILRDTAKALGPNEANEYGFGLVVADAAVAMAKNTPVEEPSPAPTVPVQPEVPAIPVP